MDNTYEKPIPRIVYQQKVAPWAFVFSLGEAIKFTLREFFEINGAESEFFPKDTEKTYSSDLRSISDTKALFSEAIKSLDLYGNYLRQPSEKTFKRLKDSLEHRKVPYYERHSQDEINTFVDSFRFYLNKKHSDNENDNYETKSTTLANKNVSYYLGFESQPRSISSHASNFDNSENDFKKTNMNENERNDETVRITSKQDNIQNDELKFGSDELKQQPQLILADNSKLRKKDEYNKNQEHSKLGKGIDGKHTENARKNSGYSGEETLLLHESNVKEEALKSRSEWMESVGEKNLREENTFLKQKIQLLEIRLQELLLDIGECGFREKAREKDERKSELLQLSSPATLLEVKTSAAIQRNTQPSNEPFLIKEHDEKLGNKIGSLSDDRARINPSLPCLIASDDQPDQQLQRTRGEKEVVPDDKGENESYVDLSCGVEKKILTMQSSSKEKTSSGEELNQSGAGVNGASAMAPTESDGNNDDSLIEQSYETLPYSIQQDYSNAPEHISLKHIPPTSVAASLYNNYMFLLLSLAQNLLSSDFVKLKVWAAERFSIVNSPNATHILIQLDQKGFIHASDLSQLRDFFESILRIDLVCVIDAFLLGDYSLFRKLSASKKLDVNRSQAQQNTAISRYQNLLSSVLNPSESSFKSLTNAGNISSRSGEGSLRTSTGSESGNESRRPITHQAATANSSNTSSLLARSPGKNQTLKNGRQNLPAPGSGPPARVTDAEVADGSVSSESRTATSSSMRRTNYLETNETRRTALPVRDHGSKLSKFQRPNSALNVQSSGTSRNNVMLQDDNWLCSHYKRHCYVKFECCDKFWPCHRCHNNQSSCGRRKLKSRDTELLKCVYCDKVQQFGQFCCECGANFANYYCGLCKHLTGKDDHPYHCEKCGICRIHGDRSFHCDVCGVCLDVQLRDNHRCRAGSAHDECCICLEDAFTGCQILPCSHKVHKECATQMIRSGITRCPICRESFAHKLERRPADSEKRSGFGK